MTSQKIRRLFLFLLPFLAIIPPIIERLRGLYSPQISQSTIVAVSAGCALIGLVLLFLDRDKWKENRLVTLLQIALIALIAFAYIDLGFGFTGLIDTLIPAIWSMPAWQRVSIYLLVFAFYVAVIGRLIWNLRADALNILVILFSVIFVSTLFISGQKPLGNWQKSDIAANTDAPAGPTEIVIILDGMIGAAGIDQSLPGGPRTFQIARDFHQRHGFRLFGKAFSRHYLSADSIPTLVNFDYSADVAHESYVDEPYAEQYEILDNRLFDQVDQNGRQVRVYQTPYLDFCKHRAVQACNTLPHYDPFGDYISPDFSEPSFAKTFLGVKSSFFNSSILVNLSVPIMNRVMNVLYDDRETGFVEYVNPVRYDALTFDLWWDRFQQDVVGSRRGSVFFAHLVFPHAPYNLDEECRAKPDWIRNGRAISEKYGVPADQLASERAKYYDVYFKQVICAYKKLDEFLTIVEADENLRDATIVLMGDHGSRISSGITKKFLKQRDYIDNYSTLFSIRGSDWKRGYDPRVISVQQLFSAVRSGEPGLGDPQSQALEAVTTISVHVSSEDEEERIVIPMPDY